MPGLQQRAPNRRANHNRNTDTRHDHAHPHPHHLDLLRGHQARAHRWENAQDTRRHESVDGSEGHVAVQSGVGGGDDDPEVHQQAGDEGEGDHGVEGAEPEVGDQIREEPTDDAAGVEDDEHGEGFLGGEGEGGDGEG